MVAGTIPAGYMTPTALLTEYLPLMLAIGSTVAGVLSMWAILRLRGMGRHLGWYSSAAISLCFIAVGHWVDLLTTINAHALIVHPVSIWLYLSIAFKFVALLKGWSDLTKQIEEEE
jgi:hypothetical protein